MERFQSVSLQLQSDGVMLWEVRVLFDALLKEMPALKRYLGATGEIVASPDFEPACVKIQLDKQNLMSRQEKSACQRFLREPQNEVNLQGPSKQGFAASVLKKARLETAKNAYKLIHVIPPTSNLAERLFSVARATYGLDRHSLLPISLEMLLFLRANERYWDAETIHHCLD